VSYLKEGIRIRNMEVKNRLVLPPMETVSGSEKGEVKAETLDYYDKITGSGHIGLVIVEHTYISPEGKANGRQLSAAEDDKIEGLRKLADTIKNNGSRAFIQLSHAGSNGPEDVQGTECVGPSPVMNPRKKNNLTPRELTVDEIKALVVKFAQAARRAKEAGFDGVEIHSAHGYLLNQFLSPLTNKRTDQYGGDLSGRILFHRQVVQAVREKVGEDYPVFVRIGASDNMEGGTTIEDSREAARELVAAGVDVIDITGGMCGFMGPEFTGQGYFSGWSESIKQAVNVPVILTGGITEPEAAEGLLKEKKADLIGVGRAILKDHNWPKRAME
jgi:2,4-dienoyl-CoA reductase-like NADH-dependent reductase (Old Yellow Enzyme family)